MDTQQIHRKPADDIQEELTDWMTPELVEHDIAEVTRSGFSGTGTDNTAYS